MRFGAAPSGAAPVSLSPLNQSHWRRLGTGYFMRFSALLISVIATGLGLSAAPEVAGKPPLFVEVEIDFEHHWAKSVHPFLGAAVIDIDADGGFEIFVGGGEGRPDGLFTHRDGAFRNVIDGTGLSSDMATYGAKAIDMDADGDTDMLIARNDGVHLYTNDGRGRFSQTTIPVSLPPESVPFDVAIGDIDRDGDADLYVSVFVAFPSFMSATFNDPDHAKTNRMLLNQGDNTFVDVTEQTGVAGAANSFCAVFTDLDLDGWQDLVVAQNTWEVEIFRNLGGLRFASVPTKTGYGFWMGAGVGDIDSDGDQDLFFPNVGDSIPEFLTRGDIREDQPHTHEWVLLRNDGDMRFTDIAVESGLDGEGFAWGGVFEDVDLDGNLDLFVAQNYIKWPVHKFFKLPGKAYLQETNSVFRSVPALGLENRNFGQSSLIVDFDGDGYQDYLWINVDGPLRAFRRTPGGDYLTVMLSDNVENLGARIRLTFDQGESHVREIVQGEGYMTDQSPERTFGTGSKTVEAVVVTWPDGHVERVTAPARNSKITISRSTATAHEDFPG